jgi:hypothetical protein
MGGNPDADGAACRIGAAYRIRGAHWIGTAYWIAPRMAARDCGLPAPSLIHPSASVTGL